jgi:hypothetical protein
MPVETWPSPETAAAATTPGAADYNAILAAVMETERGRWFLAEYARRNRHADTAEVLAALERLAARTVGRPAGAQGDIGLRDSGAPGDRLRGELADMASAIARTKMEIASIRLEPAQGDRAAETAEPLDAVIRITERATSDILAAAKQVQDVAWTMREQGMEPAFCDRLDGYATEICTACSSQDLIGQRTRKIIHVLRYVEARVQAMHGLWDAAPQPAAQATEEVAVDPAPKVAAAPIAEAVPTAAAPACDQAIGSSDGSGDADDATEPTPAAPIAPQALEPPATEAAEESGQQAACAVAPPPTSPGGPAAAELDPEIAERSHLEPTDQQIAEQRGGTSAASAVEETPTIHTVEGPTGSFSILPGRAPAPEQTPTAAAPAADPPPFEPAAEIDDLRAFAAQLIAEFGSDAGGPKTALPVIENATPAPVMPPDIAPATEAAAEIAPVTETRPNIEPEAVVANLRAFAVNFATEHRDDRDGREAITPAMTETAPVPAVPPDSAPATEEPVAAPVPVAVETATRADEVTLPLTTAPALGELPQRQAPEPVPASRRKADIAENLFADVMALTEEERIALFT